MKEKAESKTDTNVKENITSKNQCHKTKNNQ